MRMASMISRSGLIALILSGLILLQGLYAYQTSMGNLNLREENERLRVQVLSLNSTLSSLQENYTLSEQEREALQLLLEDLNNSLARWREKYLQLSLNYTLLNETLGAEISNLTSSLNALQGRFNELYENYTLLNLRYLSLSENYTLLREELEEFNTTYVHQAEEYQGLSEQLERVVEEYEQYRSDYQALVEAVNLHSDHPREEESLFITPDDSSVTSLVMSITGGWEDPSDWGEFWTDVKSLYDWVTENIPYRYDGYYPILPSSPNGTYYNYNEMWQFPNETLTLGRGDCEDMAILLATLIQSYAGDILVYCITIFNDNSGHMAVFISVPIQQDKICILDPAGEYYTNTGPPFYQITQRDIATEVEDWLDYWAGHGMAGAYVGWVFSIDDWRDFEDTSAFEAWLYSIT